MDSNVHSLWSEAALQYLLLIICGLLALAENSGVTAKVLRGSCPTLLAPPCGPHGFGELCSLLCPRFLDQ
jgi:hypothetical protein